MLFDYSRFVTRDTVCTTGAIYRLPMWFEIILCNTRILARERTWNWCKTGKLCTSTLIQLAFSVRLDGLPYWRRIYIIGLSGLDNITQSQDNSASDVRDCIMFRILQRDTCTLRRLKYYQLTIISAGNHVFFRVFTAVSYTRLQSAQLSSGWPFSQSLKWARRHLAVQKKSKKLILKNFLSKSIFSFNDFL